MFESVPACFDVSEEARMFSVCPANAELGRMSKLGMYLWPLQWWTGRYSTRVTAGRACACPMTADWPARSAGGCHTVNQNVFTPCPSPHGRHMTVVGVDGKVGMSSARLTALTWLWR